MLPRTASIQEAWDDLVCISPDGWAYSTMAWQDLIGTVPRWDLHDVGFAVERDGKLVAAMPLHYVPALRVLSSTGFGHGGPVLAPGLSATSQSKLLNAIYSRCFALGGKLGAEKLTVSISPLTARSLENRWGVNPLVMSGFDDLSSHTKLVDLAKSEEELWNALSQSARQAVRLARRQGYTVERVGWPDMLECYYDIHSENYRRTGVVPHPKEYFAGIARAMAPDAYSVLWAGRAPGGEVVAFHNSARFAEKGLYHTGCSRGDDLKSGINYLLMWEAICGARREGCRWYEIGEIFPAAKAGKERGLSILKSKFGGEVHRCFRGEIRFPEAPLRSTSPDPNGGTEPAAPAFELSVAMPSTTPAASPWWRRLLRARPETDRA